MENTESDDDPPSMKKPLLDSEITEDPQSLTQQNEIQKIQQAHNQQVSKLKKKLKVSQQKARRLKTKVKSLKSVVTQLKERKLISSSCEEMLTRNLSGVPIALLKRMTSKAGKGCKYSPELKSFALTPQFTPRKYTILCERRSILHCPILFRFASGIPKSPRIQDLPSLHLEPSKHSRQRSQEKT